MKHFLSLLDVLLLAGSAQAQTLLFDFGRHNGGYIDSGAPVLNGNVVAGANGFLPTNGVATGAATPIGGSGTYWWNSVGVAADSQMGGPATFTGFVDTNNAPIGWSIGSLNGNITGNGFTNAGGLIAGSTGGNASGIDPAFADIGVFAVAYATGDYWASQTTVSSFTLTGLDNSKTYDFTLSASRQAFTTPQDRYTHYSISGSNNASAVLQSTGIDIGTGGYDGNNDQTVSITGIAPNAGNITISWYGRNDATPGAPQTIGYFNAMQVTVIPEPTTLGLAGLGLGGFLFLRRRG